MNRQDGAVWDDTDAGDSSAGPASATVASWAAAAALALFAAAAPLAHALAQRLRASAAPARGRGVALGSGAGARGSPQAPASPTSAGTTHRAPAWPPPLPPAVGSTPRLFFGLGADEVESSEEDSEEGGSLTERELRCLQQSPAFAAWRAERCLSRRSLEEAASRLRLYRRLRALHPDSFWLLCRPDTRAGYQEVAHPPRAVLAAEYAASLLRTLAACGAAAYCWMYRPPAVTAGALLLAAWLVAAAQWAAGRPAAGRWFGAWYADVEGWGHGAHAARAAAAALADALYVVGTWGLGAAVSVALRCARGQSVGERLAGVRVVLEEKVRLDRREPPG